MSILSPRSTGAAGFELDAFPGYVTSIQCSESRLRSSNVIIFYELMVSLVWRFSNLHYHQSIEEDLVIY